MGTEVFLGYNELYNFGKSIEVGHTVGTGLRFATKELIPMTLRYPGKLVYDADNDVFWFVLSDGSFISFHDAILIRDRLKTLVGAEMLGSQYIHYEGDQTVYDKLQSISSNEILRLPRVQLSLNQETFEYTIPNQELNIHILYINRVPYFGIKDFANLAIMDFYYEFTGGNTKITLSPALNLAFSHQDVIDIFYKV